jgi:23S rRNA G2069 N7-methylase RlmK/C1962 C5-methylase RlmI
MGAIQGMERAVDDPPMVKCGRAGRRGQIIHTGFAAPDHPVLPKLAETGYLKALAFRLDG